MTETPGLPFSEFDESTFPKPPSGTPSDPELDEVHTWFRGQSRMEDRFAKVFRQAIDEVLDGQRTGRFDIYAPNVAKTERTYLGTKAEIVCQGEFQLDRGQKMDFLVAGHEVDAKFSMTSVYGQAIPKEAVGHVCLLMHADDRKNVFNAGLVRVSAEALNPGANQDGKRTLSKFGRSKVRWLVRNGHLPENQLLEMPGDLIRAIFTRGLSGQGRVNQLFRLVQGRILNRSTVITVARQLDAPKRARDARLALCKEGILVLGHTNGHPEIAHALGLPVPRKGEWVSVRVTPRPSGDLRPTATILGTESVVARPAEHSPPIRLSVE